MDVQLKRGIIEICVLASLYKEDSYGYKIIKDTSKYVDLSESTLYPILKRCETNDLLSVRSAEHNGRLRKYYQITDKGKDKIKVFLLEWKDIMEIYSFIEGEIKNG